MKFTDLSNAEIERRRKASIVALAEKERSDFEAWYQSRCDSHYWRYGKCCAGCDHWISIRGNNGECSAAGIVSGEQVLKSMGISFSSYIPAPGFPFTDMSHVCGLFCDNFDWSTLPMEYLTHIGAAKDGVIREKPSRMIAREW